MFDSTFYLQYIEHHHRENLRKNHSNLTPPPISRANSTSFLLLYTSHFLQTFGDRLWQFAVPLLFTELFTNTLFPQALFTFFTYLAVFLFMPLFGSWIDTTNRLYVVTTTIWAQNVCIIISCGIMFVLAYYHDTIIVGHMSPSTISWQLAILFVGLLITSMIGQIMGKGATLSLEKDWVVVLCTTFNDSSNGNGNKSISSMSLNTNKKLLSTVNARMRRIDLICKIVAPALFGIYTEWLGQTPNEKVYFGSMVILAWNVIGLVLEWITIKLCYDRNHNVLSLTNRRGKKAKKASAFTRIYNGWSAYSKSSVLWASISYGMLYVNVLSGGVLVTAYLKFKGLSYFVLGVTKGGGAIFGILGTFITPFLHRKMNLGMEIIGLMTVWLFWVTLVPVGIAEVLLGQYAFALPYIMLCCMMAARMGLWSFDLSIVQLMQTMVNEQVRAQINGCHGAFSQIFYMVSSVLTMIFHTVDQFFIVVWVTIITIFLAAILYTIWYIFPSCKRDTFVIEDENENEEDNLIQEQNKIVNMNAGNNKDA